MIICLHIIVGAYYGVFVVVAYSVKRCLIPSNITNCWYRAHGTLLLHVGSFLVNIIIPGHPGFDRFRALGSL